MIINLNKLKIMKNLYERLIPKLKKNLLKNKKMYDSVNDYVIPILKSKNHYTQLTISEVNTIITWTEVDTTRWSMFDYKWGDLIFKP